MYRNAINNLINWKNNKQKKPLIIKGARQVGKTWLMKYFGKEFYQNTIYINFENNPQLIEIFNNDMKIDRIILALEIYSNQKIDCNNTLIIFDEIQEAPKALTSLKYFHENAPEYQIVCAGSLLGVALHESSSFPVGKVEFLDLYPLSFEEFLIAIDETSLIKLIHNLDFDLASTFKSSYIDFLKQYYLVGGMPEVVNDFVLNRDFKRVKEIQKQILLSYEQDFSKHAPTNVVPKIRMIWNNIPSQLSKENKKYIYGNIKKGARAKEFESAILWLKDCGLIYQIYRVNKLELPLNSYIDLKAFKLFILDVGLLSCITNLSPTIILNKNEVFNQFKGALTEQYVLQQLKQISSINTFYWTNDKNSAEIDFLIDNGETIVPIEVIAEVNLKAKSLKTFSQKYNPQYSIRTSMADYKQEDWLINLPLWSIFEIDKIIK
ncbi:MAG: ATP-binding protein [Pleomorphochaeta sp.]